MNSDNSEKITNSYRRMYYKFGVDVKSLRWKNKKASETRYIELTRDINFKGKTVLDVSCGFSDIIPFISKKTKNFSYTGIDRVPEFIKICKNKYPKFKFVYRDYFANPLKEKFDIILTSGTLNSNIKDAIDFREKAIKIMLEKAGEVVAFNMAGGYPRPKNKYKKGSIYYTDSLSMLKFCLSLTSKIIFRQNYRKNDFTVVMYK